ncbi:ABC transporter substrate-binding protein [Thetidibacter halocola]|uniref:ABC transporter substrate-binding protein n=1 Tax=Thetidibacter halocola TaxID=2827239 RepID=A0A8J7WHA1_9RHOB|nr:ABC transporter substrate-binding protein [Thetidibacter halocola]MBS0126807.1 ABC transporter substrate-binding protein [Thetidibacter halocola]
MFRNFRLTCTALMMATVAAPLSAEVLRWSSQGDIVTFDPYAHTESFTASVIHHVYEPLVRRSETLSIEPALATSWEIVEPTRWRFTLREGVTFHNGNAFNADDVVTSIERLLHPDARARGNLSTVTGIEKVDDMTVDFLMAGPYPLLLNDLSGIFIMDKEWLEENDAVLPGNITTGVTSFASTNANGTGPFVLDSYQPDVGTIMSANPNWWDTPKHNLTSIEFRPITSDATRVAALLSGELDMIAPVPLQDIARLEASDGFSVIQEPALRLIFLGFNYRDELHAMPGQPNPLKDERVRKALWHAIDHDSLRDKIMRGKSRTVGILVAPPVPGYSAEADVPLPYDPKGAKALLAEAGFADGFSTKLDCPNDRYINDEQICVAVKAFWERIGLTVDLNTESRSTYFPKVDKGETDAYMLGWATLPAMDGFSVLRAILATRDGNSGGNNPNGLSDPRIDELNQLAAVELDEDKRRAMLTEALTIARDKAYFLPLHQQPVAWAIRDGVAVPQFPDEYVRLWFANVN